MSMFVQFFGPGVVACVAERTTTRLFMPGLLEAGGYGLPKAYGGVIAVNVVASTFALISLGMRVGKARKELAENAKKKGDEHADERFGLPKMQAEGFSELAKKFNCIQRGHQQALETYGSFLALSVVGGLAFPVTTIVSGVLWIYARGKWADGYATGDPAKRYQSAAGRHVWTALGNLMIASLGTALGVSGIL